MSTYEDGVRECQQLLLGEAEGFEHAAAYDGDSNPGRVFAAWAAYLRMLAAQLEQRMMLRQQVEGLADTLTEAPSP